MKWLATLVTCLALTLAAGCGGDDDSGGGSADTADQPAKKSGGAQAPEVSMKDISFKPTELSVKQGTSVTWTNHDDVGHDVNKSGGPGPKFSSGKGGGMQKGDTFKHTFNEPGTYDYVCSVHPNMSGFVIVK